MFIINFRLTINYGSNSVWSMYLDITACLCGNNGTCNFDQTTTISPNYKLASCSCRDEYTGIQNKYH